MTPEERTMLNELYEWMMEKKRQQISYPLDEASRNTLRAVISNGDGSAGLTRIINTAGATATVPSAYIGTIKLEYEGVQREVPYIA